MSTKINLNPEPIPVGHLNLLNASKVSNCPCILIFHGICRFSIMSKGLEHPLLSAQQLVACNSRGQRSCSGGYLDRAWQFIRKFG